jgi:hypothetical protein
MFKSLTASQAARYIAEESDMDFFDALDALPLAGGPYTILGGFKVTVDNETDSYIVETETEADAIARRAAEYRAAHPVRPGEAKTPQP